jgi:hypothetical protein
MMRPNRVRVGRDARPKPVEQEFPRWPAERDDLLAEDEARTGRPTWEEQPGRPVQRHTHGGQNDEARCVGPAPRPDGATPPEPIDRGSFGPRPTDIRQSTCSANFLDVQRHAQARSVRTNGPKRAGTMSGGARTSAAGEAPEWRRCLCPRWTAGGGGHAGRRTEPGGPSGFHPAIRCKCNLPENDRRTGREEA